MDILVQQILDKAYEGSRLTPEDGLRLLESNAFASLAKAADAVTQRLHSENYRTYNIDRNINYTNICHSGCRFCAFYRRPGDNEGYVLGLEDLHRKIEETIALGGNQILLQGGMNPGLTIDWYEKLLRDIKLHYPTINVHGFSPPEIEHIAKISALSIEEVLRRLKDAGLGSLPGGGAEILVDSVRNQVSPCKCSADNWLDVCRTWHKMGGRGSATMMFGHVETLMDRIEHLHRLRQLQDETGGFTAFICWTFQPGNTDLSQVKKVGAFEYLKTLAVSRLFLDNFPNLQASWVTQGLAVGQLAMRCGANDFGSLMIEENVVAAAGTSFKTTENEIRRAISETGYTPRKRNVFYQLSTESPSGIR